MAGKTDDAPDRSNERADVARRILELSGTITEAVDYMLAKLVPMREDINVYAGIIKEIGEGLISLEGAVSALSASPDSNPEDMRRLDEGYDSLSECMDAMVDACIDGRIADLPALGNVLKESLTSYCGGLSRSFRSMSIM